MSHKENTYTLEGLSLYEREGIWRPSSDALWLAEAAIPHIETGHQVMDIGCGNGIIALLIAQAQPKTSVSAIDVNARYVTTAQDNAKLNKLSIQAFTHNIIKAPLPKAYDIIVSNPPYHATHRGFGSTHKQVEHGCSKHHLATWIIHCIRSLKDGGQLFLIHHSHNLADILPLVDNYKTHITHIKTSPQRPPKRSILHIQKTSGKITEETIQKYECRKPSPKRELNPS